FFFQAEDGIRDGHVTGVQTCALPISGRRGDPEARRDRRPRRIAGRSRRRPKRAFPLYQAADRPPVRRAEAGNVDRWSHRRCRWQLATDLGSRGARSCPLAARRIRRVRGWWHHGALGAKLLAEGLIDRLYWVQSPVWLGEGAVPAFPGVPASPLADAPRWVVVERRPLGSDTLLVLDRRLCLPES